MSAKLLDIIAEVEDCVRAGKAALAEGLLNTGSACFAKAAELCAQVRHRLAVQGKKNVETQQEHTS